MEDSLSWMRTRIRKLQNWNEASSNKKNPISETVWGLLSCLIIFQSLRPPEGKSGGMWQWGGWMLLRTGLPSKWKPQPAIWKGKVYHGKTPRTTNGLLCATDFRFLSLGTTYVEPLFQFCELLNLPSLLWWTQSWHGKVSFLSTESSQLEDSELLYPIYRWRNWDSKENHWSMLLIHG